MLNRYLIFVFVLYVLTGFSFVVHAQSREAPFSAEHADRISKIGQDAYLRGDVKTAISHFQTALKHWPVHQKTWHWLTASYQHLNQLEDYQHALFFRERTAWALDVDLRHASRIFDDVAKGRVRTVKTNANYAKTAQGLVDFYKFALCRIQVAREAELAKKTELRSEIRP